MHGWAVHFLIQCLYIHCISFPKWVEEVLCAISEVIFCRENRIWGGGGNPTYGLFALFTSWPPSELWNWLCDTCWCKTLTRECWITPLRSALARKTHVNVSSSATRVNVSPLLKLSLFTVSSSHHGIFLPFITRHLKQMIGICCIPSHITLNFSPA